MVEVELYNDNVKRMMGDYQKAIWKMAWPMILTLLITSSYNLGDGILVSILGTDAFAAVGFVTPLFMVINGIANGLGAGASSFIAMKIGAKDKNAADLGVGQSIFLSVFISIIFTIILLAFQKNILISLVASKVINLFLQYSTVLVICTIFLITSSVLTGIFRAEGDVKKPLYVLVSTAVLNTFLDHIFTIPWGFNFSISASSYGAGLYERVRGVFFYSLKLAFILSILSGIMIFVFAPQLSSLYYLSENTKVFSSLVAVMLKIYLIFFIATPIGVLSGLFFQSLGKGPISLGLTLIREFILSIICLIFFVFILNMGVVGVFLGLAIGKLLGAFVAFLYANYYSKNFKKMNKYKSNI
ncbi:MATE family efflux transporter [uncultured Methanobrevibacter sp.]|uniref:MATE family efflux transporter n=1 Tax=uncultured Methanobrevibacter sp. TaxID=253161 RepID=UPI0025DE9DDD|nr:MATE family efflux transporter [uncultured Methanobrevibacter sp.]